MNSPRLSRRELAFVVGVPAAWGVLLLFHPQGDTTDFFPVIRDNVGAWQAVHIGMAVFVPLFAGAIYLLLRGIDGTAAKVSRIGLAVFAVFYAAWELVLGVGTGILANEVNALPGPEQAAGAALVESYAESTILFVFSSIGSVALGVAMIGAVVALRGEYQLGWASIVLMVLAIPLVAIHEPPYGPIGLALFIVAVLMFMRHRVSAPAPAVPVGPTPA